MPNEFSRETSIDESKQEFLATANSIRSWSPALPRFSGETSTDDGGHETSATARSTGGSRGSNAGLTTDLADLEQSLTQPEVHLTAMEELRSFVEAGDMRRLRDLRVMGRTPLLFAASNYDEELGLKLLALACKAQEGREEDVRAGPSDCGLPEAALPAAEALSVNERGDNGYTVLHFCAVADLVDLATALLELPGIDPCVRSDEVILGSTFAQPGGRLPLHVATFAGNLDMVRLFLEHRADPTAEDDLGNTSVGLAAARHVPPLASQAFASSAEPESSSAEPSLSSVSAEPASLPSAEPSSSSSSSAAATAPAPASSSPRASSSLAAVAPTSASSSTSSEHPIFPEATVMRFKTTIKTDPVMKLLLEAAFGSEPKKWPMAPEPEVVAAKVTADRAEVLRQQREAAVSEQWRKWVVLPGIFSSEESALVLRSVLATAELRGWRTQRHARYATTDLPIHDVPSVERWVRCVCQKRLFPEVARFFGLEAGASSVGFRDLFFVRYDAEGQRGLPNHRDGSLVSFNILLGDPKDFEGGGTYLGEEFDATVRLERSGDCLVHGGMIFHAGVPITRGYRHVLVGFLNVNGVNTA